MFCSASVVPSQLQFQFRDAKVQVLVFSGLTLLSNQDLHDSGSRVPTQPDVEIFIHDDEVVKAKLPLFASAVLAGA